MNVLRDLSVILLAAEAFIFTLIPLVLVGGLVYGMWQLLKHENLPTWLVQTREYVEAGCSFIERAMGAVVRPIFAIHARLATVQAWLHTITRKGGS